MEPNKFEQHIKDQLNQRKIKPSEDAWQKIANQLGIKEKPKTKKYLWLGIAASFIGLLIVTTIYYNSDKKIKNEEIIVDSQKDSVEINHLKTDTVFETAKETLTSTNTVNNEKVVSSNLKKTQGVETTAIITINSKTQPIESVVKENKNDKNLVSTEELINTKLTEVIAVMTKMEQNAEKLTDIEVDSLIKQAQNELLNQKLFRQNKSVDAIALLNEIESELDQSLKEQLFELLKEGVLEARNALAERN
ncbi:MAG TPA: hypothetical protein DDZ39_06230 [Flavobacteriaceae bacterium]|jgi:hypothetical protein|nr:hypothetical protein [Flavobacteriaceae bacterium]HBS11896.1 hypothetical protein [Flavobacteriaceae bacterium]